MYRGSDSSVVERQPEKLKVVGSNPIPDKMLFLLYFVFLLIITNSSEFVLDFTPTTFVVLIVVLNIFLKYTTFEVYIINIKYFFTNIFLQINSLGLFLKNFNLKYLLSFQPCPLK